MGDIITDITEMSRIIRDYFEQLYANKMDKKKQKNLKNNQLIKT